MLLLLLLPLPVPAIVVPWLDEKRVGWADEGKGREARLQLQAIARREM